MQKVQQTFTKHTHSTLTTCSTSLIKLFYLFGSCTIIYGYLTSVNIATDTANREQITNADMAYILEETVP